MGSRERLCASVKPPKVAKKLWEGRQPLGRIINGLPELYMAKLESGDWAIMQDKSTGESTGSQVCLATISPVNMALLLGNAKAPYALSVVPAASPPRPRKAPRRQPSSVTDSGDGQLPDPSDTPPPTAPIAVGTQGMPLGLAPDWLALETRIRRALVKRSPAGDH